MARKKRTKKTDRTPWFDDLNPHTRQAIWAVLVGLLAALFLLSLLEYAGLVGQYVSWSLRALFGAGAWLAPIACIVYIFVLLNPKESDQEVSRSKVVGTMLLFVTLLSGIELYNEGLGGLVGLTLAWPLAFLLDTTVSAILIFGLFLISIFLLFNTGLKLPKRATPTDAADDADPVVYADESVEPEPSTEPEPESESDDAEEPERGGTFGAMTNRVKKLGKGKSDDIVVKHYSGTYDPPSLTLLNKEKGKAQIGDVKASSNTIKRTLREFGISVEMDAVESGPTISRYALKPAQGVRISKIAGLQQELQLALKADSIRIEAPIPGKSLVGIEVPNQTRATVGLANLLTNPEYTDSPHPLLVALGKDVTGNVHFSNLARMPHGLIAGTTGSGKSVMIQNLIISLLYRNSPDQLRFILVDPKRVELTLYNNIPHLLTPVITQAKKAIQALSWAVKEMERRYDVLQAESVQNITSYHKNVYRPAKEAWEAAGSPEEEEKDLPEAMPFIVVIIDELNDLMQAYPKELEACIVRLAQMSRAVGIHLILATQRPSVNVITGTIKANVPSRIAFAVASQIDSRTILDAPGAEKLIGAGDMLYLSADSPKPVRLQSAFVSEEEIKRVVDYLKAQESDLPDTIDFDAPEHSSNDSIFNSAVGAEGNGDDELFNEAVQAVREANKASTSYLQRKLRIGYSRAARLVDELEEHGIIGPGNGAKPREVYPPGDESSTMADEEDEEAHEDRDEYLR